MHTDADISVASIPSPLEGTQMQRGLKHGYIMSKWGGETPQ